MPRYRYKCEGCEEQFVVLHSFSETREQCLLCGHVGITKMLGKPVIVNKKESDPRATGAITNEYIEANRELLKQMKEEASNGLYDET